MKLTYKSIAIYIDSEQNLILIPNGLSPQELIRGIDMVYELKYPYIDDELEQMLLDVLEVSFSIVPEDTNTTVLESFLGIKGYSKAIRGRKYISFEWLKDKGFSFIPTTKKTNGFLFSESITIGKNIQKGDLAASFKRALELSK